MPDPMPMRPLALYLPPLPPTNYRSDYQQTLPSSYVLLEGRIMKKYPPMILTVTIHPALDKIVRLPRLLPHDAVRSRIEMQYGGGKGNNAARALTRLGIPVTASGFQGGYTGELLIKQFAEEGVSADYVICQSPTRTSLMIVEEETGQTYAIYEPGQKVEPDELEKFRTHFLHLLEQAHLVLFCGSGQTSELAALHFDLIQAAEGRGIHCGLDSSGAALREGIKAKPHMVKINRNELAELTGKPLPELDDQIKAMLDLHETGIALVALSRGSDGLLVTDGKTCWQAALTMDKVVNVMGCGDSLLAGMSAAMLKDSNLADIARSGVACGAANTQVLGAGFIDPALVKKLIPQVTLRQVPVGNL